jgi:hypothetical protein
MTATAVEKPPAVCYIMIGARPALREESMRKHARVEAILPAVLPLEALQALGKW